MDRILDFTGNHPLLAVAFMISFFLLVFTELRRKASGLVNLEPSGAVALINDDALVVDLRSNEAFARGHIVNARNIPYDEFEAKRDSILKAKNRKVIAVCDAGASSNKVVAALRHSGHENVFGLKGGMHAWTQAGLPVVTAKKTKSKK